MKKSICVFVAVVVSISVFSQNSQSQRLDSLFTTLHYKNFFNGNVLVADKGKIIFEKSYGIADESTKRKLNTETIFELASVSKQFTAMGIVMLQKAGKLNYDDKISKYIPELAFYEGVTIRNLLNHTGGLPDYMGMFQQKWDNSKFAINKDIIEMLAAEKPKALFNPGNKFDYSNTGYALLASIVEKVSGKTFAAYLNETIFKPLGMKSTFVYRSKFEKRDIDNYAFGYIANEKGEKVRAKYYSKEIPFNYLDGIVGDGMVNSTLGDLLKWDRALYTNKLVNAADKKLIFNAAETKDGKGSGYGFGWAVGKSDKYGKVVNHSGSWSGNLTFIERQLDNDKTFIILQNNDTGLNQIPSKQVRKILNNESLKSKNGIPIKLSAEELQQYEGVYGNDNFPIDIKFFVQNGALMGQGDGQGAFPLESFANHKFVFEQAKISLVFDLENNTISFTQNGQTFAFNKK